MYFFDQLKFVVTVNVCGFWGPAENGGDEKNKINVVPLIFMKFWSRNNLDQLDLIPSQCISFVLDFQFSSTTTFVTVDGRGIGNNNPYKPVNTEYTPVSAFLDRLLWN